MGPVAHARIFAAELLASAGDKRPPKLIEAVARQTNERTAQRIIVDTNVCTAWSVPHLLCSACTKVGR